MKGKIFLVLFALPFLGVGLWMAYSAGSNLLSAWQMQQWQPVEATLTHAGYHTHSGDDSDTYEAFAEYRYTFGGRNYRNDRVAIAGGADNVGEFQTDLGNRLGAALRDGRPIVVYVNPDDPTEAVVDRSPRWALLGFKSVFVLAFGGVGLGLIIYVFRAPRARDPSAPEFRDRPWLANDCWQSADVKSGSKMAMYFAWGFAAFWSLISAPLPFVVYREVLEKDNFVALVGLLFPLVGVGLITWAVRRTLEWHRFGPAPVRLDPFPGSIGGHVGGTIDIRLPYDSPARFVVTLTSLRSYVSGSGKNRSRKESAKWQDTQAAHVSAGSKGTRLSFRFDLPAGLRESDAVKDSESYYLWRLNVRAELAGADLDRDYEIPVYATRQESANIAGSFIQQVRAAQKSIDAEAIGNLVRLGYGEGGQSMVFPVGRNLLSGLGALIFGAIFAGAGWFLIRYEGQAIMGGIFGAVGVLSAFSALYFVLNSLEVLQDGGDIRTVRRVLGIPVRYRRMRRPDLDRLEKKVSSTMQSGGRHIVQYAVNAVDRTGRKMLVGEGFRGASQADAAAEFIASRFGLKPQHAAPQTSTGFDTTNFLAGP